MLRVTRQRTMLDAGCCPVRGGCTSVVMNRNMGYAWVMPSCACRGAPGHTPIRPIKVVSIFDCDRQIILTTDLPGGAPLLTRSPHPHRNFEPGAARLAGRELPLTHHHGKRWGQNPDRSGYHSWGFVRTSHNSHPDVRHARYLNALPEYCTMLCTLLQRLSIADAAGF